MRSFYVATSLGCLVLAAACSSSAPATDGGALLDLTPGHDLGGGADLGMTPDGGGAPDSAPALDGGVADAGHVDTGVADAGSHDAGHDAGHDMGPSRDVRCGDPRPTGAPMPPPLPTYSGGTCPTLVPGVNSITSAGNTRSFILVTPTTIAPGEQLPLLFMWHWLGGDADGFLTRGNVQAAADSMRFIAAIPDKKGDVLISIPFVRDIDMCWPYLTTSSDARITEELTLFDDILSCVSSEYTVDQDCVSSVGVSAGALWTSQLLQRRADRLSSAIVLSGGIGPATSTHFIDALGFESPPPSHALPTLVLWGGPMDTCALNFETASHNMESALEANGSFILECTHNCGHNVPPVEDPTFGVAALYRFAFDHPYWLNAGESPYYVRGLPAGMPDWCSIGAGTATIRTGMCSGSTSCGVPAL